MLTFCEADLLMRQGEDVRFSNWPAGDFVRRCPEGAYAKEVNGYTLTPWQPTVNELTQPNWSKS